MARDFGFEPMTTPPYYFISYNSQDTPRISEICRELEKRNVPMWYDKGLLSGEKWEKQITHFIKNCHEVILFVTKDLMARQNPFVYKEYELAHELHKKTHIVMLDRIQFENVSDELKVWFIDIQKLQDVYPPANASAAQVADAMEKQIHFLRKPASSPEPQTAEAPQPTAQSGTAKRDKSLKAAQKVKEKAADNGKKPLPLKWILTAGAALLLTAAVGTGVWLLSGQGKKDTQTYDSPEKYVCQYIAETDSYAITGLADDSPTILKIPASIDDKPVTDIGEKAFYDCANVKEIVIPSSVTTIGNGAFINCSALTEITIPSSVKSIGGGAFINCTSLTEVNAQEPSSLKTIGNWAFCGCSALTDISVPPCVTGIGSSVFRNCTALKNVYIPASVKSVDPSAFLGCENLVRIEADKNNASYASEDGVLYSKHMTELVTYPKGKNGNYLMPSSITRIGESDFNNCKNLTAITIPSSVANIDVAAFTGCDSLESIEVDNNNNNYISGDGVLYDKNNAKFLYYPAARKGGYTIPSFIKSIGAKDFPECKNLTDLTIPATLTNIDLRPFKDCENLVSIDVEEGSDYFSSENGVLYNKDKSTLLIYPQKKKGNFVIPDSVKTISYMAFYKCDSLTEVTIPASVTTIGTWTFEYCSNLKKVNILASPQSLSKGMFSDCTNLTDINIPASVTSLGNYIILGCEKLDGVEVEKGNAFYSSEDNVLYNKDMTELIMCSQTKQGAFEIPSSVRKIHPSAFQSCKDVTEIKIPPSVTTIGDWAFEKCTSLKRISIPSSVTSIGYNIFGTCTGLSYIEVEQGNPSFSSENGVMYNKDKTTLLRYPEGKQFESQFEIPSSVTGVGHCAFHQCTNLSRIDMLPSITDIDFYAFDECSELTEIVIPPSVKIIKKMTFENCAKLTEIDIPSSVTEIGEEAFIGCTNLKIIHIPTSVTSINETAFSKCDKIIIFGKSHSYAEQFAKDNDVPFVAE